MSAEDEASPDAAERAAEKARRASMSLAAVEPVVAALRRALPRAFRDVSLLVSELARVAVLEDEEFLASLRDLHADVARRSAEVRHEAARLGEENAAEPSATLAARRAAVMMPAVASLDRLVRETLNLAGGGFVTPHARAFAKRHCEGLLAAVDAFAAEPDVAGGWRVVKSEMARVARGVHRRRHLRLRDLSPALAGLKKRASAAWMPGCEPDEDVSDGSDDVLVVSVADAVAALPSKTRPKRVTLVGDDGVERVFLLKGHEDLRLDERVMSTLRAANDAFASHDSSRSRRLSARTYTVTPLADGGFDSVGGARDAAVGDVL